MRPPTEQRVSEFLDALITVGQAIPNVSVNDGPLRQEVVRKDRLLVGFSSSGASVDVRLTPQPGLNANAYLERITVTCAVVSWAGGKNIKPQRDRVTEILSAFRSGVAADITLGSVVDRALLGDQLWMPVSNTDGAAMGVQFKVVGETSI